MSCFGGHDEQIYLAEILIDRLTLTSTKIKDIGGHPIVIKIKLLDLPVFEITRDHSDTTSPHHRGRGADPDDGSVRFAIGRCCLFVKRPQDLVRELRSSRLKVGVFRAGDSYPTAETELTLPGCLCDQVAMIGNDNLPRPFAVKGGFHLLDPGENPSGMLHMELNVECLGRVATARHELHPKHPVPPVFGEQDKERELRVRRFVSAAYLAEKKDAVTQPVEEIKPETAKPPRKMKKEKKEAKKKRGKKR